MFAFAASDDSTVGRKKPHDRRPRSPGSAICRVRAAPSSPPLVGSNGVVRARSTSRRLPRHAISPTPAALSVCSSGHVALGRRRSRSAYVLGGGQGRPLAFASASINRVTSSSTNLARCLSITSP